MKPSEELKAFKDEERVPGFFEGLSEEEKMARNIKYTELKINVDIFNDDIVKLDEAKQEELKVFDKERDEARQVIGKKHSELMDLFLAKYD